MRWPPAKRDGQPGLIVADNAVPTQLCVDAGCLSRARREWERGVTRICNDRRSGRTHRRLTFDLSGLP